MTTLTIFLELIGSVAIVVIAIASRSTEILRTAAVYFLARADSLDRQREEMTTSYSKWEERVKDEQAKKHGDINNLFESEVARVRKG